MTNKSIQALRFQDKVATATSEPAAQSGNVQSFATPKTTVIPVQPGERFQLIDIVRGFAIFGILLRCFTKVLWAMPMV